MNAILAYHSSDDDEPIPDGLIKKSFRPRPLDDLLESKLHHDFGPALSDADLPVCPLTKRSLKHPCQVCHASELKYRCPQCGTGSCSMECVAKHKKDKECEGVRPRSSFVPMNKMNINHLLNDYQLLEHAHMQAGSSFRDGRFQGQDVDVALTPRFRQILLLAQKYTPPLTLELLPMGLSLHKQNSTIRKGNNIFWRIDLTFPKAQSTVSSNRFCDEWKWKWLLEQHLLPGGSQDIQAWLQARRQRAGNSAKNANTSVDIEATPGLTDASASSSSSSSSSFPSSSSSSSASSSSPSSSPSSSSSSSSSSPSCPSSPASSPPAELEALPSNLANDQTNNTKTNNNKGKRNKRNKRPQPEGPRKREKREEKPEGESKGEKRERPDAEGLDANALTRHRLKLYHQAEFSVLKMFIQIPFRPANKPAFHEIDLNLTVAEFLAGKRLIEYPRVFVALPDEVHLYPCEQV